MAAGRRHETQPEVDDVGGYVSGRSPQGPQPIQGVGVFPHEPGFTPHPTPRRAFLHLVACVSLSLIFALAEAFGLGGRQRTGVRGIEMALDIDRLVEQVRILCAWFSRAGRHPRYSPREILLILEYGDRYSLSAPELARDFLVSVSTVRRWRKLRREALAGTNPFVPQTKSTPPCRRICDSTREFVADMAVAGYTHDRTISRHLQHQGEKVSARSVGRFRACLLAPPKTPAQRMHVRLKDPAEPLDVCAAYVPGPEHVWRPRVAHHVRVLANALTEGIATHTLRLDDPYAYRDTNALLRSRRAEQLALLVSRMSRIKPRHRPRHTDAERADILAIKARCRLSNKTTAKWFLLDPHTISDWTQDVDHPDQRRRPLVTTLPDMETAVTSVAEALLYVPKRLQRTVAETLAALATRIPSRISIVRRTGQKKTRPDPTPRTLRPIHPLYPNHCWTSDLTILGGPFHLCAIVDLYSRDILVWDLFPSQPTSEEVAVLFDQAVHRHGKPEHFVSDRGGPFVGEALGAALDAHRVERHKGAVGQHGSIAIIERAWRTTKECLDLQNVQPRVLQVLYERIAIVIDYYRTKRPHMSLDNATPAEVYRGERSRAHHALPAPRGWRGESSPPPPFVIRHAFPEEMKLPYLERIA